MSIDLHDLQAEDAALAAALTNEAACAYLVEHCREDDFWHLRSRKAMHSIAKLHAAGRPVDAVTVRTAVCSGLDVEEAQRLGDYVGHLGSTFVVATNVAEYVASIVAFSAKRRFIVAGEAIRDAALSANGNLADLPGRLEAIAAEAVEEVRTRGVGAGAQAPAADRRAFVDWSALWSDDADAAEWDYPDVLARGRGHAIYAVHKAGKSLLALFMAARIATEEGHHVLYVDYEMTAHDVRERLADMGYGPESDLSRLHYALLPSLPPLDTASGGEALVRLLDAAAPGTPAVHFVVIIDTISRAVEGEENSADTWRLFYTHTGLHLKQRGCTWLRLAHGGKDAERGQRGSSGQGDDVDVVWKLKPTENGVTLERELSRMAWVPKTVQLLQEDYPLRYLPAACDWPPGTAEVANILDRLGLPLDVTERTAGTKLREIDEGRRHDVVAAALKWRRQRAADHFRQKSSQARGAFPGNTGERGEQSGADTTGTSGEQPGTPPDLASGTERGTAGNRVTDKRQGGGSPSLERGPPPAC